MVLLPDGTVAAPSPATTRSRLLQNYSKQNVVPQNQTDFQSPQHAIRMIRENSLLDIIDPFEEEEDRLSALRQKKRSIEQRVQVNGGNQPLHVTQTYIGGDVEEHQYELRSPVSVEDVERQYFWKQFALVSTILLVSTGLILFAVSFFWDGIAFT
jgi:hypothetical protein